MRDLFFSIFFFMVFQLIADAMPGPRFCFVFPGNSEAVRLKAHFLTSGARSHSTHIYPFVLGAMTLGPPPF